jgi:hypothetical protein
MTRRFSIAFLAGLVAVATALPAPAAAQGVTTGALAGLVNDQQQQPVPGATVTAVHDPSGTRYVAVTLGDGRFSLIGVRVGGPYTVKAELQGFTAHEIGGVVVTLGTTVDLVFALKVAGVEEAVTVVGKSDPVFSTQRTGAATTLEREVLYSLPTISGRLDSIVRLSPQSGGGLSFAGQDSRFNNITVDGSYFNNSFGLRNSPGDTSGVAPISLAAIEQVQVSVAPFDVRQGNFVGAGVNTVTRSGTNSIKGSFYHQFRSNDFVGTKAGANTVNPGTFTFKNTGGWIGGPIQRNRTFFFFSFEDEALQSPGTTFRANAGGEAVGGSTTRVLRSDLETLVGFLQNNFTYGAGTFEGFTFETPARRYLVKADYSLNDQNKLVFRYNHLDSSTDQLVSNSTSLGFGNRRGTTAGLSLSSANYEILENIRSFIGEWNSVIGTSMANHLIVGYTKQDESRGKLGTIFPFVDVLQDGSTYTSFGSEPFTPSNELRYNTFQLQDNFTRFGTRHSQTFGVSFERYESENIFFPGSQSVYVYNSIQDFYTDALGAVANPARTVSPVQLRRFQVRWSNIPGQDRPIQPLQVNYIGAYAQDEWRARPNMKITAGLRVDVPIFAETGYQNATADALTFRDEFGNAVTYSTKKLPDANALWSPRVGFNWDVTSNQQTQVRGGTGVFTGKPAYVWISNQVGNTGVLTGFEQLDNTTARPFSPDPNRYKPATVTGGPPASYELALTEPDFKFPQIWRTNIAVDRRLVMGMTGTAEFIYNKDVNGVYYINANLPAAQTAFTGADMRPRWTSNRIHASVSNATVLKNQNVGSSWNMAFSLERQLQGGWFGKMGYSYGKSENTVDPGSIAFGSWSGNPHSADPNNPGVGISGTAPGHRFFTAGSYQKQFFSFGATTLSFFLEANQGNTSYTYSGDLNGDGGTNNDLIYIPRDMSEMNFQQFTSGGVTYTALQQAEAWEQFILADPYLRSHRGQYAGRGAKFLPVIARVDFSLTQDVAATVGGRRHAFQFRLDVLNFLNLLNTDWGTGQRLTSNQPLIVPAANQGGAVDAQGRAQHRLRLLGTALIKTPLERTAGLGDVWRIQISLRYLFN